ncbi:MAG: peptidoglycan DD-metalloendopeptidase family protein [Dehalococcoidia bacterium]
MVPPTINYRIVIPLGIALVALLLGACTVGDKPEQTPTTAPANTAPPSASVAPPAALAQTTANAEFILSITRKSRYIWPAQGAITSYFGPGHPTGIDIALDLNSTSPIRAAGDGRVTFAGGNPCCSLGNRVEIEHANGGKTVYGHLEIIDVYEGLEVKQGDQLGLGGATGEADGKHLHFEVYQDGVVVDPFRFLPADQQTVSGVDRVSCAEAAIRIDPDSQLEIRVLPRTLSGYEIQTVAYTGLTATARSMNVVATKQSVLTANVKIPALAAAMGETLDAGLDIVLTSTGAASQQVSCRMTMRTRLTLPNPPGTGERHIAEALTPVPTATPTRTPISGPITAPVLQPTPAAAPPRNPTPLRPPVLNPSPMRPPVQSP